MKHSRRTQREYNHVSGLWLGAAGLAMALVTGCGPQTNIQVRQPGLQGAQRELYLSTEQAYWAEGKTAGRLLAEFPLPGASTGRATYLFYLRLPEAGSTSSENKNGDIKGCGFFIQTRGEDAGLTGVSGGTVRVRHRDRNSCKLAFNLECDDGTRIEGEVLATRNEPYVHLFEKESRPVDVERLVKSCSTQSAPSG